MARILRDPNASKSDSKVAVLRPKGMVNRGNKPRRLISRWDRAKAQQLEKFPYCQCCGTQDALQVHHVLPKHLFPDLEYELSNLVTLCMSANKCHLNIGHLGSWNDYNMNLRAALNL